ncbi:hypothetical protein LOK49_LG11G00035 [Camellia lanceoleosa]|uniref:Uncharacterized protein n=1 Tax=Camellia lanceoleosa TaxID=1840588 RepID=A0ACC0G2H6_9ERIC|nr:hypothetical protein LOK49_LG11G00035 [Camellia lanceoleosa]
MPSLQTALPPELANNAIRLYRECLRRAKYIGTRQYNTELVVDMVRQQFKKHMHETDPEKIQKLKDDAARGLINHMLYESEKMSGRSKSNMPSLQTALLPELANNAIRLYRECLRRAKYIGTQKFDHN